MKIPNINDIFFKRAAIVFFIGFFTLGCFVFSDYGISCDESLQRRIGEVYYNRITTGDANELLSFGDRDHGPFFEVFLFSAEKLFNLKDFRNIFLLRHAFNFLTFFIATLFFYLLGLKFFKSHGAALLCSIMLVASPRIFADSFYNSKDLPMLYFCIIASYTAFLFVERQTIWWALIHALFCGIVLDIRIIGLILPFATMYLYVMQKQKKIIPFLIFISYTVIFTIAFWPLLWLNPVFYFIETFKSLSHYALPITALYMGKIIDCQNLPWHYLPVWISITTPFFYIVFFLVGLFFVVKNSFADFASTLPFQFSLFMFAAPIFSIILLNSTIYDSYRHIFFIYPFLLLIAVYGFTQLTKALKKMWAVKIISYSMGISILYVFVFMIINHPYQNVYFNFLAGKDCRKNFELDYWGLSYKQGLEYILANDKSEQVNIAANLGECYLNFYSIPVEDRKRLVWTTDVKSANYYLTNFRWHPEECDFGTPVFQINVGNAKIMEVQKLK